MGTTAFIGTNPEVLVPDCPSFSKNAGGGPSDTMHSSAYSQGDLSSNSRGLASRFNGSAWKASSGQPTSALWRISTGC